MILALKNSEVRDVRTRNEKPIEAIFSFGILRCNHVCSTKVFFMPNNNNIIAIFLTLLFP